MSRARKKKADMNSLGVALSPGGLAGAERSEGERSEPQRSVSPSKVDAAPGSSSRPDPEVVAKPNRRTYTAEYKQHILEEADVAAATRSGLGALLRREGLHSSLTYLAHNLVLKRRCVSLGVFFFNPQLGQRMLKIF